MLKKMLLAGAVIMGGALFTTEKADAQVYIGPSVYGGPVYAPPVRTFNPYVVPRYGAGYRYGYQPGFRGPAFGAPAYRGPVYRSYRGPRYGVPYYGRGMGRGSGFSLQIGPSFRGW